MRVQEQAGMRGLAEQRGLAMIQPVMAPEHRSFLQMMSFVVLAIVDPVTDQPAAAIVAGPAGIVATATATEVTLRFIDAGPLDDGVRALLSGPPGAAIGMTAIDFANRRRIRFNADLASPLGARGTVTARVTQSFGNCPKFIQSRRIIYDPAAAAGVGAPQTVEAGGPELSDDAAAMLAAADTLFLATCAPRKRSGGFEGRADSDGADVSHRGGKPGFVRVVRSPGQPTVLWAPDYEGNHMYNSLGNLRVNPRCALLVPQFGGDLLTVKGTATVAWSGPEVASFAGAQRMLIITIESWSLHRAALWALRPVTGTEDPSYYSPYLAGTGCWPADLRGGGASAPAVAWRPLVILAVNAEANGVASFCLAAPAGEPPLAPAVPGQYLEIRLPADGTGRRLQRAWSISNAPSRDGYYRLTIKRVAGGAASSWMHDHCIPGTMLESLPPAGDFVAPAAGGHPLVLVTAGVGVTPAMAILESLVSRAADERPAPPIVWAHGTRHGGEHIFAARSRELMALCDAHVVAYSCPRVLDDVLGRDYDVAGRLDGDTVSAAVERAAVGAVPRAEYLICGPPSFMAKIVGRLLELGVPRDRLRTESFEPVSV